MTSPNHAAISEALERLARVLGPRGPGRIELTYLRAVNGLVHGRGPEPMQALAAELRAAADIADEAAHLATRPPTDDDTVQEA